MRRGLIGAVGAGALFATTAAAAAPALLTNGHAYCFYFSTPEPGGMHLVAFGARTIAAGPSNYVSGTNGHPQDTVVFFGCVDAAGNQDGSLYVGLPRVVLHRVHGQFHFAEHVVVSHLHRIDAVTPGNLTATVTITGTAARGSSSTGAIVGTLRVAAPGCLAHPIAFSYTGT